MYRTSKIGFLKDLTITEEDGVLWCDFGKFFELLIQKSKDFPGVPKTFRKYDILQEVKRHHYGIRQQGDATEVCYKSILTYLVRHADESPLLKSGLSDVASLTLMGPSQEQAKLSALDLYKIIATNSFVISSLLEIIDSSCFNKSTCVEIHQEHFSDEEWTYVLLFEHHFYLEHTESVGQVDYEHLMTLKWDYYNKIKCAVASKSRSEKTLHDVISTREKRKIDVNDTVSLKVGTTLHSPLFMEKDFVEKYGIDDTIVASIVFLDCCKSCKNIHLPGIHVYMEVKESTEAYRQNLITSVQSYLQNYHSISCQNVMIFKEGCFETHRDLCGSVDRFLLRDAIRNRSRNDQLLCHWSSTITQEDELHEAESPKCSKCFPLEEVKPLAIGKVDIATEWITTVPLISQIFLEQFVNLHSLKKAKEPLSFLQSKVKKLYTTFDTLLNISNKNYLGIIQQQNTEDLTMNYRCVNTVFNITSSSGASASLNAAENQIKDKATKELCYYRTYIKCHPLTYQSVAGEVEGLLSLRNDCIIIFLMDNLVKLRYHADPDPGENRSMQLCALPLTVKGIPKDDIQVSKWHETSLCDGTASCQCLKDEDFEKETTMESSPQEKSAFDNYSKLMTWGSPHLWDKVHTGVLWQYAIKNPGEKLDNDDTLDYSFGAMSLLSEDTTEDVQSEAVACEVLHGMSEEDIHQEDEEAETLTQNNILQEIENVELHEVPNDEMEDFEMLFESLNVTSDSVDGGEIHSLNETDIHGTSACEDRSKGTKQWYESFGISLYSPPPCLTLHPYPATGRDDDIHKLREILDDFMQKSDYDEALSYKVLCAPDHKIGNNLLKLRKEKKYKAFLPEFPVLHLRKSKITNICSAYKDAGLLHIMKYMRDEEVQEWTKLIHAAHIDKATRYIKRISLGFHVAFMLKFMQTLKVDCRDCLIQALQHNEIHTIASLIERYNTFVNNGREISATFSLHFDIMTHCDEIGAISLAERMGGPAGYNLLLGAIWSSLPFAFLNGASSYASFCTQLLDVHYRSGPFYKNMKASMFAAPFKDGKKNFALDAHREMDHIDINKAYRAGGGLAAVIPKIALIDSLLSKTDPTSDVEKTGEELLGLGLTPTDMSYITRVAGLILRCGGLNVESCVIPQNVYAKETYNLPEATLDSETMALGQFLMRRHACYLGLFGYDTKCLNPVTDIAGPSDLIKKVKAWKQGKTVTIRRVSNKKLGTTTSERQVKEGARAKVVAKQTKVIQCMSSEMNACQALVKPDCSKPKVTKASGIKTALTVVLEKCTDGATTCQPLIQIGSKKLPDGIASKIKVATCEFAGVKFKSNAISGLQYLKYTENAIINNFIKQLPNMHHLTVVEEKYSFTPDDLKAATREQRKKEAKYSISHLKTTDEMLTDDKLDKMCLTTTAEGKGLVSTYLARNVSQLSLHRGIVLDIDSELHSYGCDCGDAPCPRGGRCEHFTCPLRSYFTSDGNFQSSKVLSSIKQRKGEAELAQIDWLNIYQDQLVRGDACLSIVSSGDIDAIPCHMFALSHCWPRNADKSFTHSVYVLLQKAGGSFDLYDVTGILERLEASYGISHIGLIVSSLLCLGGNDFLPRLSGISHQKLVESVLNNNILEKLFDVKYNDGHLLNVSVNISTYKYLFKCLYIQKTLNPLDFQYDEIRQMSVQMPTRNAQAVSKHPRSWMPPESAVDQLAKLVDLQLKYFLTIGRSEAIMPEFLTCGVLTKLESGEVEYDFGSDVHVDRASDILLFEPSVLLEKIACSRRARREKRGPEPKSTPRKGGPRKRPLMTSTPKKISTVNKVK